MSGFISSKIDSVVSWAQASSLWTYSISGGCCADELLSSQGCRYDLERFGCLPQAHPEQADLLIVSTAVTPKLIAVIREVYDRMPNPKYVMAVGACANSGGLFTPRVSHASASPLEEIIPVDVYVPGCPPRPEAIMNGLIQLQEKIKGGSRAHAT
jgi:NADH-quinone oxidoreductase subunit B